MFGRKPILPIDTVFDIETSERSKNTSMREYIDELKGRMKKTREIVG